MLADVIRGITIFAKPRRADWPGAFRHRRLAGSISPTAAASIGAAIQNQEGYYPGSLAYTNNNPGNLVYAGQPGAVPGAGGFASFPSYQLGYNAMLNQISLDASRGTDASGKPITTLSELLTSWAPPSENNTAAYISSVSSQTGFDPDAPLSQLAAGSSAVPVFSVDVYGNSDGSDETAAASDGSMLSDSLGASVGLSSIGISSPVPLWWLLLGALGLAYVASD